MTQLLNKEKSTADEYLILQAGVERLRAERKLHEFRNRSISESRLSQAGRKAGRMWAAEYASPSDMESLPSMTDLSDCNKEFSLREMFMFDSKCSQSEFSEFWSGVFDVGDPEIEKKIEDDSFARGFIRGALDLWSQV
ncbi:hypothetical protein [uncultured Rubinisphaera sp.]|uniref:hypothetical protein n=1 Tax=uncultured Rubinisphaera sp. TaxID=1678686 RepID=UPI0030DC2C8C